MSWQDAIAVPAAPRTSQSASSVGRDGRVAFVASWALYQTLARALGEQYVRLAYDGARIELTSPGREHEVLKVLVERLVGALAGALGVPCKGFGSMRWERPEAERGLEGDATFYLTPAKMQVARRRPASDAEYPVPDLAVEIDTSPPLVDRESIYRALGVPEVWRLDGETLRIDLLNTDGAYSPALESSLLGIRPDEVIHLLRVVAAESDDDNDFTRRVAAWARDVLLPRRQG